MSAKNLDKQNRWRNKTVAFRMSPEEAEQLDVNVRLSGLSKQDYLIQRALQREIKDTIRQIDTTLNGLKEEGGGG